MIDDHKAWVRQALSELRKVFGARLLYLGLQGSYRRGEAAAASDIDLVAVFDRLDAADLESYRRVIKSLPQGELACGFVCGAEEMRAWPRQELFQFKMDTDDYFGVLDDFLPPLTREDIREGVKAGASALYHAAIHAFVFEPAEQRAESLRGLLKAAFFVLLGDHYLKTGIYRAGKKDLHRHLSGPEQEIAAGFLDFEPWLKDRSLPEAYELLINCCGRLIKN